MKSEKLRAFLSFVAAFFICCLLFLSISYIFLRTPSVNSVAPKQKTVPAQITDGFSVGITFSNTFYKLRINPAGKKATLRRTSSYEEENSDRHIGLDTAALRRICEANGGVEYSRGGVTVGLTGQHFAEQADSEDFCMLFALLIEKIFSSESRLNATYSLICELCDTDISYMDFYGSIEVLIGIPVTI